MRTCEIDDCESRAVGRGLCNKHYLRLRKHGSVDAIKVIRVCRMDDCHRPHHGLGLCIRHYQRYHLYGDPFWSGEEDFIDSCRMPRCRREHHGLGLCKTHHTRYLKYGDPFFDGFHYPECKIEGCYLPTSRTGLCQKHYRNKTRYGNPLHNTGRSVTAMGVDLPFEPLDRVLESFGGVCAAMDRNGVLDPNERERIEKAVGRARKAGVIDIAHGDDVTCKALGLHPALVWGDAWWTSDIHAEPDYIEELTAA